MIDMKFAHKGLRALFERDDAPRLNADHVERIRRVLTDLQHASAPHDMARPGYDLHPLKGDGVCVFPATGESCSVSSTAKSWMWI